MWNVYATAKNPLESETVGQRRERKANAKEGSLKSSRSTHDVTETTDPVEAFDQWRESKSSGSVKSTTSSKSSGKETTSSASLFGNAFKSLGGSRKPSQEPVYQTPSSDIYVSTSLIQTVCEAAELPGSPTAPPWANPFRAPHTRPNLIPSPIPSPSIIEGRKDRSPPALDLSKSALLERRASHIPEESHAQQNDVAVVDDGDAYPDLDIPRRRGSRRSSHSDDFQKSKSPRKFSQSSRDVDTRVKASRGLSQSKFDGKNLPAVVPEVGTPPYSPNPADLSSLSGHMTFDFAAKMLVPPGSTSVNKATSPNTAYFPTVKKSDLIRPAPLPTPQEETLTTNDSRHSVGLPTSQDHLLPNKIGDTNLPGKQVPRSSDSFTQASKSSEELQSALDVTTKETTNPQEGSPMEKTLSLHVTPADIMLRVIEFASSRILSQRLVEDWGNSESELMEHIKFEKRLWALVAYANLSSQHPLLQAYTPNLATAAGGKPKMVLDLCGQVADSWYLALKNPAAIVHSLSHSSSTFELRSSVWGLLQNLTTLSWSNMPSLPYPSSFFDTIVVRFNALTICSTDWPLFIKDCVRVLKPGGSLVITVMDPSLRNSGPHLQRWAMKHIILGLERKFMVTRPTMMIPLWLEDVAELQDAVIERGSFPAAHVSMSKDTLIDRSITEAENGSYFPPQKDQELDGLRTAVGRHFFQFLYEPVLVSENSLSKAGSWWWDDAAVVKECGEQNTAIEIVTFTCHKKDVS